MNGDLNALAEEMMKEEEVHGRVYKDHEQRALRLARAYLRLVEAGDDQRNAAVSFIDNNIFRSAKTNELIIIKSQAMERLDVLTEKIRAWDAAKEGT